MITSGIIAAYHIWSNREVNIYEKNIREFEIKYIPEGYEIFSSYESAIKCEYIYKNFSDYDVKTFSIHMEKDNTTLGASHTPTIKTEQLTINGCEAVLSKDLADGDYSVWIDIGYNYIGISGDLYEKEEILKIAENIK